MNQANTERLLREHPLLFRDGEFFDCLDGWSELIRELSDSLELLCAKQKWWKKRPMLSSQVKEKLGGLRFYVDNIAPGAEVLIAAAERRSRDTCEACGNPGSVRSEEGRLSTRCDQHAATGADASEVRDPDREANLVIFRSRRATGPPSR